MREIRLVRLLLWSACWLVSGGATAPVAAAAAGEWTRVREVDGVEVYRQPVEGSDIPAVRGRTQFRSPVGDVFRVISDYDHFPEFIPSVSDSRVVERDDRATWVYQRLGFPLPVADRHYIIKVVNDLHVAGAGVVDVGWQLDEVRSASLSSSDALLPAAFSGSWHLEALADHAGCEALYTIHVDPAGALPGWLFVRLTERYVVRVMNAVRKRIEVRRR